MATQLQPNSNQPRNDTALRRMLVNTVVGLFVLFVLLLAGAAWWYARQPAGSLSSLQPLNYPLENATAATVTLAPGTAGLYLNAGLSDNRLIEGSIQHLSVEQVVPQVWRGENRIEYRLESEHPAVVREPPQWPQWNLRLNPNLPIQLSIKNGMPTSSVDLRGLQITRLDVDASVGHINLILPGSGTIQARFVGGGSRSSIQIPKTMAVKIQATRAGNGSIEIFGHTWTGGGNYTSPGFETSANRVELEVIGGMSHLSVGWID